MVYFHLLFPEKQSSKDMLTQVCNFWLVNVCVLEAEEICLLNKGYKEDLNVSLKGKVLLPQV